jgi:transketolase
VAKPDLTKIDELKKIAGRVRVEIIRNVHIAQGGHPGGSLSVAELLTALYFHTLRIDPKNPQWEDRDRFVLSKGHASIALYAVLAERGYFPVEELATFDAIDSRMQAHPDMKVTPGIDMSTGSLGQGLSVGVGMALGAKMLKKDFLTYVMIGDGETQEGQIWEAAFSAERYGLDNLIGILDYNKVQLYGWQHPQPLCPMDEPAKKFQAFGWHIIELDGHDFEAIIVGLEAAKQVKGRPTMIIADTVKGRGVSFMEGCYEWHAKPPNDDECILALGELSSCQ